MLIRFAHDLFALARRESIPEGDIAIAQRNFPPVSIQDRHQRANSEGESITGFARKQRNQFRCEEQPGPLKTVADFFPNRTHGSLYTEICRGGTRSPSALLKYSRRNRLRFEIAPGGSRCTFGLVRARVYFVYAF